MRMGTIDELAEKTGSKVIPADATSIEDLQKLIDESINFCKELQKNGPKSISNSLKCINNSYDYSLMDGLEIELEAFSNSFGSNEANEGMSAFVNKRKPKFKK